MMRVLRQSSLASAGIIALILGACGRFSFTVKDPTSGTLQSSVGPVFMDTGPGLKAEQLAVLVNDDDPQSVAVAQYYVQKRQIPDGHVFHFHLPTGVQSITSTDFAPIKQHLDTVVNSTIQAYAITWTQPFRVDGMSITSAFALGYDSKYAGGCNETAAVPYFNSDSVAPFHDFGIRPAMMLAGKSAADIYPVIDRGVAADATHPHGTGYFIKTSDTKRSVRFPSFYQLAQLWDEPDTNVAMEYLDDSLTTQDYITDKTDILFYETSLAGVPHIDQNTYLPGAVADHLTSFGGYVPTSVQMSAVAWLEAGATASFGTVVEPCNYTEKFPNPLILAPHYQRGETVLEAYWKSVVWPGQGLFIGEPLARPFGEPEVSFAGNTFTVRISWLRAKKIYQLEGAETPEGPFVPVETGIKAARTGNSQLDVGWNTITIDHPAYRYYRLVESH